MWTLFQSLVMMAIGSAGIYWHWTPNPVALGVVIILGAWLATRLVSRVL
jgi:hypothetical protein